MINKVGLFDLFEALVSVAFVSIFLIGSASAISLGVSPESLQFEAGEGVISRNLVVINNGNEPACYEIYTDNEHSDWLEITPSTFELSPGTTREVTVKCSPPSTAEGNVSFKISILASPEGEGMAVGAGVRIPVIVVNGNVQVSSENTFSSDFFSKNPENQILMNFLSGIRSFNIF